ncbi:hypothetical protein HDV06_003426 [Boothiomyces sp. JEL0866]|nr:hypothetical protein HDV06_003378 [Boothiomyces sp. JEL0866]KAJ3325656.1 hypothetical protein HDV06_003426 [Boothiomyces sp. JEL0866]
MAVTSSRIISTILQNIIELVAHSDNSKILTPVVEILNLQIIPIKKLQLNLEKYPNYYDTEHFQKSLEFHLHVILGMRTLAIDYLSSTIIRKILHSRKNKRTIEELIAKLIMSSNSLQLGINFEGSLRRHVRTEMDKYSDDSSTTSEDDKLRLLLENVSVKASAYVESVFASNSIPEPEMKLRDYYLRAQHLFYAECPDYSTAFQLFTSAKALPEAQHYLGMCYLYGFGTRKDSTKAKAYLLNAWTQASFPTALYHLGLLFEIENNKLEAFRYFHSAAAFKVAGACEKVAYYYTTFDLIKDDAEAEHWKRKAALLNVIN